MKTIFFAAALIFSAATWSVEAQSPTPTATQVASPTPEMATSVSSGPDWKLPRPQGSATDLLVNQQQTPYTRPDARTRFKRYVNGIVGPIALAKQLAGAGIGTWRNSPEEWGGQWEGFGKRLASGFGKNLIKQTTTYGMDEALKLDSTIIEARRMMSVRK